jgi:hypothetical protein
MELGDVSAGEHMMFAESHIQPTQTSGTKNGAGMANGTNAIKIMEASDADETKPEESGSALAGVGTRESPGCTVRLAGGLGGNMGDGLQKQVGF